MFAQPHELFVSDPLAGETDAKALQRGAHFVEVPYFLLAEFLDEPHFVRQLDDESVGFEAMERFANRRRADVELLRNGIGTQLHARLDPARHDPAPERAVRPRAELQAERERLERQILRLARRLAI